ncbi:hypothetical protein [Saccharospirillum impatiens]|uniref:GAP1-N1 domain-containing protein n=1 Tax=Saccharospirillum impatiens TaxID=169438 RepID=UPI00041AAA30|nr:hypothetical protein [Saccharospirillum impatiens]
MITAQTQVHGYRKGHQLLASSVVLSKDDQLTVDRLSDVTGPLRPKEKFAPYISAYPLPSGTYYVIARTWQDFSVLRAGCVRTKSVLIDAQTWAFKPPLASVLSLLESDELPDVNEATSIEINEQFEEAFLPILNFNASEMLEALFLEEAKPVVVFDAPNPELISLRLLAALWPELRSKFALSTFSLSPRKIGGRDLDLVFAPSNAKAKFSDWGGRRVDGRSPRADRHRWTKSIIRRAFEEPVPRLLSESEIDLLGEKNVFSTSALRITLLWEELIDKLDVTPTAALGLLDIANSGKVSSVAVMEILQPKLSDAMRKIADDLMPDDAWEFVSAITQKMQGRNMPVGRAALNELALHLTQVAPESAIKFLQQPDPKSAFGDLTPAIAKGLGRGRSPNVEQFLLDAPSNIFAQLISQSDELIRRVVIDDKLINRIEVVLIEAESELSEKAGKKLLPYLVEDRQLPAARSIFQKLSSQEVADELRWLGKVGNFNAKELSALLIDRAREIEGLSAVRDVLLYSSFSDERDALFRQVLEPSVTDILWLLEEDGLAESSCTNLLVYLLRYADDNQFVNLLAEETIGRQLLERIPETAVDLQVRAVLLDTLPINAHTSLIQVVIPKVMDRQKFEIADRVIGRCLCSQFAGDEAALLLMLLGFLGSKLDGERVVRYALDTGVDAEVASRNLIVFNIAPLPARYRILGAVKEIARALQSRQSMDLSEEAYNSCAMLMADSEQEYGKALVDASVLLVPSLFYAYQRPVSQLIAVLFPKIYKELASASDVPDFLKYISIFDWDRCKIARKELVKAFMTSSWKPGDLALTAIRCNDVSRILKRVAKSHGAKEYLARIEYDLEGLNDKDRVIVERVLAELR